MTMLTHSHLPVILLFDVLKLNQINVLGIMPYLKIQALFTEFTTEVLTCISDRNRHVWAPINCLWRFDCSVSKYYSVTLPLIALSYSVVGPICQFNCTNPKHMAPVDKYLLGILININWNLIIFMVMEGKTLSQRLKLGKDCLLKQNNTRYET